MNLASNPRLALRLKQACLECGLQSHCLPAGLCAEDIARLDKIIRNRRPLAARQVLFHAGAPCSSLHLVRAGTLMSLMPLGDGGQQVLGFHLPGEMLGLDALGSQVHDCTVIALERSSVCELPIQALHELGCELPAVQQAVDRAIGRELQTEHQHVAMLGRHFAHQRLAAFLIGLSSRQARLSRDPLQLRLVMSRGQIASFLGLAVETVSRLFRRFQDEGLLAVGRRSARILDLERLVDCCRS